MPQNTENLRNLLKENLSGSDITEISFKCGISITKIRSYLDGKGTIESEFGRILDIALKYYMEKYKKMLEIIGCAGYGKCSVSVLVED